MRRALIIDDSDGWDRVNDPCKDLLAAILERAILDYYCQVNTSKKVTFETCVQIDEFSTKIFKNRIKKYFFSDYYPHDFGSLWFIAENLAQDPDEFVRSVRNLITNNPDSPPAELVLIRKKELYKNAN